MNSITKILQKDNLAFSWGYEDATEGNDQRPSAYFAPNSPAWHAYNEGYREGCLHAAVLTGAQPTYVDFGSDADANYVPFQCPELYANVLPDYQREDYIGM